MQWATCELSQIAIALQEEVWIEYLSEQASRIPRLQFVVEAMSNRCTGGKLDTIDATGPHPLESSTGGTNAH